MSGWRLSGCVVGPISVTLIPSRRSSSAAASDGVLNVLRTLTSIGTLPLRPRQRHRRRRRAAQARIDVGDDVQDSHGRHDGYRAGTGAPKTSASVFPRYRRVSAIAARCRPLRICVALYAQQAELVLERCRRCTAGNARASTAPRARTPRASSSPSPRRAGGTRRDTAGCGPTSSRRRTCGSIARCRARSAASGRSARRAGRAQRLK